MDTHSFYTRQMLMQYGKQLITARRLARYDLLTGKRPILSQESVAQQRRFMVERVAREIMENLLFSGSDNPIVQEVHRVFALETGEKFIFRYPPAELDFKMFRISEDGTEIEVEEEEKQQLMQKLWVVVLKIVDATML